ISGGRALLILGVYRWFQPTPPEKRHEIGCDAFSFRNQPVLRPESSPFAMIRDKTLLWGERAGQSEAIHPVKKIATRSAPDVVLLKQFHSIPQGPETRLEERVVHPTQTNYVGKIASMLGSVGPSDNMACNQQCAIDHVAYCALTLIVIDCQFVDSS